MRNLAKSIVTAGLLAVAVLAIGVEVVAPKLPPYAMPPDVRTQRTDSVSPVKRLELLAGDGAIRIGVHTDPAATSCDVSAEIRLYRIGEVKDYKGPEPLAERVATIHATDGIVQVRSLPDDWPPEIAAVVKYTITVPRGTDIDVRGVNGNVWVAEGCGKVSIESGNADVEVRNPSGPVVARSTNGRLRLFGGRGPSVLETVNGNIRAEMMDGSLTAESVNGRVQAELLGPDVLACALRSENGDVNVGLDEGIGFTLDANAARGNVIGSTGLPLRAASPGSFRATEGTGATRLTLSSGNGSIRLSRK